MTAVLGVLAAAAHARREHLAQLPARGLALETRAGVELQTMRGRPLGVLEGLDLAPDKAVSHGLPMRSRRGRLFTLDLYERRVRRFFEGPVSSAELSSASPERQDCSTPLPNGRSLQKCAGRLRIVQDPAPAPRG